LSKHTNKQYIAQKSWHVSASEPKQGQQTNTPLRKLFLNGAKHL